MQKFATKFVLGIVIVSLVGCATVKDVQRATDIIRTDNELARIIVDVRPQDKGTAETDLTFLANHAKKKGDALKNTRNGTHDAIAYYRIAATAYWKSGNPRATNDLFETVNSGTEICNKMGEKAPDRDCLFLQLVIPFAGIESFASEKGLTELLENVHFDDERDTPNEIQTMNEVGVSLVQARTLVESILTIGKDDRLLSHPGMNEYYCNNAKMAKGYFTSKVGIYLTNVQEFESAFPNHTPPLNVTFEKALELRELNVAVPKFCEQ